MEDTGIGIPEDMIDHVFGQFNQVENERNRQFDGTGLGLSISQSLVQRAGGLISACNLDPKGAVFSIWLPDAEATDIAAQ